MPAPRKYPDELRERSIRFACDLVDGPEELSVNAACRRVGTQLGIPGSTAVRRRFALEVRELDGAGSTLTLGPLSVRSWAVDHASGAPALTIQAQLGDAAFGYSAWTEALVESARGTDLFACEAYTYDKPVPYHLDYATLRRHSSRLATDRLILTHMGPTTLSRLDQVEHDTASDGLVIHL